MHTHFLQPPRQQLLALVKNTVTSLVALASGGHRPDVEALLMPFDLGILICVVAPGLRPAPAARRPPDLPLAPAIEAEVAPVEPSKPKRSRLQDCLGQKPFRSHAKRI